MITVSPRGGVTVPSGVPITPDQAFVTGMAQFLANYATAFDLSGINATSLTADGGAQLQAILIGYYDYTGATNPYKFGNNAITDPALVNAILVACVNANIQNASIDLSGGVLYLEIYQLFFTGTLHGSTDDSKYYIIRSKIVEYLISFRTDIPLSSSSFDGTYFRLGISGVPSSISIASKFAALYNADLSGGGVAVANGDGTATITDSTFDNFPYNQFSDNGSGITSSQIQVGGYNPAMAAPPPAVVHKDEIYTLTIPAIQLPGGPFQVRWATGSCTITFDNTIPLSSSSNNGSGNITLGIQDTPTQEQLSATASSLWENSDGATSVDNGNGSFTNTSATEANYPYSFQDFGSGITSVENQAGVALVPNAAETTLTGNGCTVTTN